MKGFLVWNASLAAVRLMKSGNADMLQGVHILNVTFKCVDLVLSKTPRSVVPLYIRHY